MNKKKDKHKKNLKKHITKDKIMSKKETKVNTKTQEKPLVRPKHFKVRTRKDDIFIGKDGVGNGSKLVGRDQFGRDVNTKENETPVVYEDLKSRGGNPCPRVLTEKQQHMEDAWEQQLTGWKKGKPLK